MIYQNSFSIDSGIVTGLGIIKPNLLICFGATQYFVVNIRQEMFIFDE